MRAGTPVAVAMTYATPRARTSRLVAVAALAALLIASAGSAPAWSAMEDRVLVTGGGTSTLRLAASAVVEERGGTGAAEIRQRPRIGPFSMNLYSRGDFVNQKTAYWCIPASTQTMMNIMDRGRPNRSRVLQARLYRVGDRLEEDGTFSDEPEPDRYRGMGISEWVGLLNRYDYGPYKLVGAKTRQNALRRAANMMRETGKPVGLVVWRGAHAWVMSGFTATADPAVTDDFRITSVWVQDPWYPRVSSTWGPSHPPNTRVSARVLGQDFKPYGRPGRRDPERDGLYMLVLPA